MNGIILFINIEVEFQLSNGSVSVMPLKKKKSQII